MSSEAIVDCVQRSFNQSRITVPMEAWGVIGNVEGSTSNAGKP